MRLLDLAHVLWIIDSIDCSGMTQLDNGNTKSQTRPAKPKNIASFVMIILGLVVVTCIFSGVAIWCFLQFFSTLVGVLDGNIPSDVSNLIFLTATGLISLILAVVLLAAAVTFAFGFL